MEEQEGDGEKEAGEREKKKKSGNSVPNSLWPLCNEQCGTLE